MSKLRTDQLESLDSTKQVNIVDIVDGSAITTSTGTQTLEGALDQRVISVPSISDLYTYENLVANQQFSVGGESGGKFYYDQNDTESPDDGMYVIVTPEGLRIKRLGLSSSEKIPGGIIGDIGSAAYRDEDYFSDLDNASEDTESNVFGTSEVVLTPPTGFPWSPEFSIIRGRDDKFRVSIDPQNFIPDADVILYVSQQNGSDANAGTSPSSPKSTINGALSSSVYTSASGGAIIYVEPGFWSANDAIQPNQIIRDTAIICREGKAYISSGSATYDRSWTQQSSPNDDVYKATFENFNGTAWTSKVLDEEGLWTKLTEVSSVNECQATPGSYYHTGDDVYFHAHNDGLPTQRGYYLGSVSSIGNSHSTNYMFYAKNIVFCLGNGFNVVGSSGAEPCVFDQCSFRYMGGNGFDHDDRGGFLFLKDCDAKMNGLDGFNYYDSGGNDTVLEVDCEGSRNGWAGGGNNNGSTGHEDSVIIRVGGTYDRNQDRNVHDVHNVKSWNIACYAGRSVNNTSEYNSFNLGAGRNGETDTAELWLDMCTTQGSVADFYVGPASAIRTRRMKISDKVADVSDGGTYENY